MVGERMKKVLKKVASHSIAFLLGVIACSVIGAYAATTLPSSSVYYNNSNSGGSSTTVSGAIDELYQRSNNQCFRGNACVSAIVKAYEYDSAQYGGSYCITGDEETCVETTCYKNKTAGSCTAGTIVEYMVNDEEKVKFQIIFDNGNTLTMLAQKVIGTAVPWISKEDYAAANTDGTSCTLSACNDEGPITILTELENATVGWDNVNRLTYTPGVTVFKTNAYTGCSATSCTANTYTLEQRSANARLLTVQEAIALGCKSSSKSCPKWMYGSEYWLMNSSNSATYAGYISSYGELKFPSVTYEHYARPVVEVNK